jgi:protein O-GlcNAc transferase
LKAGRNDPCPCGSGKKAKKCCDAAPRPPHALAATAATAGAAPRQAAPAADPRPPLPGQLPTPAELDQLMALFRAAQYPALEHHARALIARAPHAGLAWKALGAALQAQGHDLSAVLAVLRRASELLPHDAEAHNTLGDLLRRLRHLDAAEASCRRALALAPGFAGAHNNLANALKELGRHDAALEHYRRAMALAPADALPHFNLGNLLRELGRLDPAAAAYRQAIALAPGFAQAHSNLGRVQHMLGELDQALASYRRALELEPQRAEAHSNLGHVLKEAACLDQALACFQRAVTLAPSQTQAHSNLLYTLYFHPAFDERAILAAAREFTALHGARPARHEPAAPGSVGAPSAAPANSSTASTAKPPLPQAAGAPSHGGPHAAHRRLRIGYVSPDFREHCQALFTLPLLAHHDRTQFEIYCYADLPHPDAVSRRLASHAEVWRRTDGLSDAQLAACIEADGIDVLVDLTMHMAGGRPRVFAARAAPVQVAWLAYPGTAGIAGLDYRLTDPWLDPPELGEHRYAERSLRLADTFWCYDPLIEAPLLETLQPNALPALACGYVTFGCLNNFCKVSDATLERWGATLARVPDARLLLLSCAGAHRQRVLDTLARHGVAAARIEFVPYQARADYLRTYHRIDICLDTLPYNGHTTSLDAYWMGVPVVTEVGRTVVGRAGWSQLNNLGLPELAAFDAQGFSDIAVALAHDLPRLGRLRQTLRARLAASPLMDAPRFARAIEAAYRELAAG